MSDFKAKMHKIFDFRWGSTQDHSGRAYSAPTDPPAVFKGPTSKGREEIDGGKGRGGKGKGRKGQEPYSLLGVRQFFGARQS